MRIRFKLTKQWDIYYYPASLSYFEENFTTMLMLMLTGAAW